MTDTPSLLSWLRATLDDYEKAARKAAALCGCHPPAPSWSFHDGDEPTDGRILVVNDPHPDMKWKIGRRWNSSYQGLFMAEHIVRHDPAAALRRIAADRKLLDDMLTEPHAVLTPGGSTEIYCNADTNPDEPCNCGRDARVQRRVRLLAEGWGWTEEVPQ